MRETVLDLGATSVTTFILLYVSLFFCILDEKKKMIQRKRILK